MTRSDDERFADILNAIDRCQSYEHYLRSDEFGSMAYDAVLRNIVVHEYFRVNPHGTKCHQSWAAMIATAVVAMLPRTARQRRPQAPAPAPP
ncbi:MAG TPA: hypothetical protein VFG63_06800 [Nocardioidaceae bacterium]|nr:hypothetical protein [Nocardioidaceae bacterium]